jgi:hypothetical protein
VELNLLARVPVDVPVDPDAPEARDWLIDELSKPQYQEAKPSFFDQLVSAFWDWVNSLELGNVKGPPAFGVGAIILVIVVAVVVAVLVFGLPRLNRRSTVAGALFGEEDDRNADTMRRAATAAAAQGDYRTAIAEMFRSIARGLAERTIVTTNPGTTAHEFSVIAAQAFPRLREALADAAASFDGVRYLDRDGSAEQFARIAALESELRAAKPAFAAEPALA